LKKLNALLLNDLFSAILTYDITSPNSSVGSPNLSTEMLFAYDSLAAAQRGLKNLLSGSNVSSGKIILQ